MAQPGDVLERIDEHYQKMSRSHKKIAGYILENYDQAVFMTAAKLGSVLGISESTVVRFAYALGYDGYPEFQKALEECIREKLNSASEIRTRYDESSQSRILTSVIKSDIDKLEDTMETLDPAAFDAAVDIILKADNVYVMGLRSNEVLAEFLQFYLSMVRKNVVLLRTTSISETFEQMIRISEKDCFIGISFPRYSMRTLKAMEFANDRNAKVIAITDSSHSPMNLYSSCNLFARSDMVSIVDSLVAPLSVINALIVAICLRCPNEVRDNLEELEKVWDNYQVYMNDEIDFINEDSLFGEISIRSGNERGEAQK